jgi:hypothetical protein
VLLKCKWHYGVFILTNYDLALRLMVVLTDLLGLKLLPVIGWNATSLAKLLSAYGGIIGFDSFRYSILGHINLLIGTRQGRFLKESIILRLNGTDYHIHIHKLDPLRFLV